MKKEGDSIVSMSCDIVDSTLELLVPNKIVSGRFFDVNISLFVRTKYVNS